MKTLPEISINQQPLKWKQLKRPLITSGSGLLSFLSELYSRSVCFLRGVQTHLTTRRAHVVQDLHAIPASIKPLVKSAILNNRIYVGLGLVTVVGPLSTCIQMLPGMKDLVSKEWFYECWYNLFLVLGPYFFSASIVLAAFLWIPPVSKRIKWSQKDIKFQLTRALSIPLGLIIAKIIWLIFCDSNADFEALPHWSFLSGGLVIGYVAIRFLDYLVWRQEHVMNALIDSLEGLYNLDIDHKMRTDMAKPYWKELREFHSKY